MLRQRGEGAVVQDGECERKVRGASTTGTGRGGGGKRERLGEVVAGSRAGEGTECMERGGMGKGAGGGRRRRDGCCVAMLRLLPRQGEETAKWKVRI